MNKIDYDAIASDPRMIKASYESGCSVDEFMKRVLRAAGIKVKSVLQKKSAAN